jgi:formate hydrogenlyase subunit 3/multisubunit Na+/H+ antiporter MnhD subunit
VFDEKLNMMSSDSLSKDSKIAQLEKELEENKKKHFEGKKEVFIKNKISKWRQKSFIPFVIGLLMIIGGLIYFLYQASWNPTEALTLFTAWQNNIIVLFVIFIGGIIFAYSCKMIYDCYFSHSQIENFKKGINIPDKFE